MKTLNHITSYNQIAVSLLCLLLLLCVTPFARATESTVNTWVFVHGAWGGGWDWKNMAEPMIRAGDVAYRPTLTGLGARSHLATPQTSLQTHIDDIVKLIEVEDLRDIVLVGHSYGGMVITGVADEIPQRIKRLVYIDAVLPENGESMMQLRPENVEQWTQLANEKGDGWRIPPYWKNPGLDTAQPLKTFTQPIELDNPDRNTIAAHYILTRKAGMQWDRFLKFSKRARSRGWPVSELATGHNPQRTMPKALLKLLRANPGAD